MENETKIKSSPWRSMVKLGVAFALVVLAIVGYRNLWTKPPTYTVAQRVKLTVPILTLEEHDELGEHDRPYIVDIEAERGALLYFGSEHVKDPHHPQTAKITEQWEAFEPTVALVEGRLGLYLGGMSRGISRFGESGAVYVLARRDDVPVYTLELDFADEATALVDEFPAEHVAMYYVLRPYFGAVRHGPIEDPESFVRKFIRKRASRYGMEGTIESVADIDRIWKRDFADKPDWRELDDRYGCWYGYLSPVADKCNKLRNEHWAQMMIELVRRGERVFAVAGCCHAVCHGPALRATLAEAE